MRSRKEIKTFIQELCDSNKNTTLDNAKAFAIFAHDSLVDKDNNNVIGHVFRVVDTLKSKYPNDEFLQICGYLHDVIEDGGFLLSDIKMFFPEYIWSIIDCLTRYKLETKQEYIHKVSSNYYASIVKIETISDKINILSQKLNKSENDRIIEEKLHSEYIYYKNTVIVLKKPEIVFFS